MILNKQLVVALASAILLGGVAVAQAAVPAPTEQAATAEAAPTSATTETPAPPAATSVPVASGPVGTPPEGKGQVVFFRPNRFAGGALVFTVRENGADLGKLSSGKYFVQVSEPGIHEFEIGRNDTVRLEVEAGQTYYLQNNISMGIVAGRAILVPADHAAFDAALPHMHVSEPITK